MSSRMPSAYGCDGSISHRVSSSISGSVFGRSPYTLFVEQWITGASMQCSRTFCSTLSVPTALTSKSVYGSRTAQSCDGCAAVCTTTAMSLPYFRKMPASASRSRMSMSWWEYASGSSVVSRSTFHAVDASEPKNCARMSLSMPTTSRPSPAKCRTASEPIRPAEPVTTATLTVNLRLRCPPSIRVEHSPGGQNPPSRAPHAGSYAADPGRQPFLCPGTLSFAPGDVAEWQTRTVQVRVQETEWGFNSPIPTTQLQVGGGPTRHLKIA